MYISNICTIDLQSKKRPIMQTVGRVLGTLLAASRLPILPVN